MSRTTDFDMAKANEKTIEEAIENAVAGAGTIVAAVVTSSLGKIIDLDANAQLTVTVAVSSGVMGLLKTVIRRIRNRRKHGG